MGWDFFGSPIFLYTYVCIYNKKGWYSFTILNCFDVSDIFLTELFNECLNDAWYITFFELLCTIDVCGCYSLPKH